jgi:16S rRNA processing protein RimM
VPHSENNHRQKAKRVLVARIGAPHGVRGDVKLWSFTAQPDAVAAYGPLESEDGSRSFTIETFRPAKDFFIVHLAGVDDRNAAERLTNTDLYVPRGRLPAADEGEFYHADLIGLAVTDDAGARLGNVVAVHNFGAGDLLELRLEGASDTVMIPFTPEVVPRVDIAEGRIVVNMPGEA